MARWLTAILVLTLTAGGAWLAFLNEAPVTIAVWPTVTTTAPLGIALLVAFGLGVGLVTLLAATNAGRRRVRGWRRGRLRRREASDAARLAQVAETLLDDGDAAGARTMLDDARAVVDTSPRLLALLAEAAERTGDVGASAAAIEHARTLEPESPRVARRLRDLYARAGRWSEAVAVQGQLLLDLRDATTFAAEEHRLRCYRFESAMAEPDDLRAARILRALAREDRRFLGPAVAAGDRYVAAGKTGAAQRLWTRAVKRRPAAVLIDRLEGMLSPDRLGRLLGALADRHTDTPWLRLRQARVLLGQQRFDEALAAVGRLPDGPSGHPRTIALRAEIHRGRGELERATELFAQAEGADRGFTCTACRQPTPTWSPRCGVCGTWDGLCTMEETLA